MFYRSFYKKRPDALKKVFDTSDILSEEDKRDINDIEEVKKVLSAYLDKNKLIKKFIEIIENSDIIDFKNERSKKFIDSRRPMFNLVIDFKKIQEKEKHPITFSSEADEVRFFSNILHDEILFKVTDYIQTSVHSDPDLESFILNKEIFKDYKDDKDGLKKILSIITTIFGLRFNATDKRNVIIEMML